MITELIDDLLISLSADLISDEQGDANVYNLSLETDANYLLEDGGLIILE